MDKIKILLIGGTGMAGHVIYTYLKETNKYEMFNLVFSKKLNDDSITLDVRDTLKLEEIILKLQPNIVINCVGALVSQSKSNPGNAIFLNAYLPHLLVKIIDKVGGKLLHISTDCVFSGKRGNYKELDFRDADDVYGRSKALGEIDSSKHVTIRTSIIGPELKSKGEGLFDWFINQKGIVKGYSNVKWSGVTTLELAKQIDIVIKNDLVGLFQLTNGDVISKFELLELIQNSFNAFDFMTITSDNMKISNKTLCKSDRFNFNIPSYIMMIENLNIWMIDRSYLYKENYPYLYENINN